VIRGVLFDLDGTLLDTAPDLVFAVNTALEEEGFDTCRSEDLKPLISGGAKAMLRHAVSERRPEFDRLLQRTLNIYEKNVAVHTRFFDGMESLLDHLEQTGLPWGIVTNKMSRFTEPLARVLGLSQRADCIISGDTTPERKPHPLPMLEACKRLARQPEQCVYVGDAAHDIAAGRRAGMATLAAVYGYLGPDDEPHVWGADGLVHRPLDIARWLQGTLAP